MSRITHNGENSGGSLLKSVQNQQKASKLSKFFLNLETFCRCCNSSARLLTFVFVLVQNRSESNWDSRSCNLVMVANGF